MAMLNLTGRYYRIFPPEKFLGHAEESLALEAQQTAFLVVDVYGLGFSDDDEGEAHAYPSMSLAESFEAEKEIVVNHIRPAMDAARRAGLKVVYVNNSAPRIGINQSELGKLGRRSCDLDWEEWGSEDMWIPESMCTGIQRR